MKLKNNLSTALMITLTSTLLVFTACEKDKESTPSVADGSGDPVTDIVGNTYQTVWIGGQNWMAENLKTTTYNDGTPIELAEKIAEWKDTTNGSYCWYDNDQEQYAETFGALYNWHAIETGNLCPEGWHIPSDTEWTALTNYIVADGHSNTEGAALKAKIEWNAGEHGFDNYGFKALPGGCRDYDGTFNYAGSRAYWWSATKSNTNYASTRLIIGEKNNVMSFFTRLEEGFHVRCLKD